MIKLVIALILVALILGVGGLAKLLRNSRCSPSGLRSSWSARNNGAANGKSRSAGEKED